MFITSCCGFSVFRTSVLYRPLCVFSGWLTARASHYSLVWLGLSCQECFCQHCVLVFQGSIKCPGEFFSYFLFCFLSERLTGNVFLLAELSFQDIQQKFYAFGHMKATTLSTLQPLLSRHKAAPVQTFHRVAKVPICIGFHKKTAVSHSSAS